MKKTTKQKIFIWSLKLSFSSKIGEMYCNSCVTDNSCVITLSITQPVFARFTVIKRLVLLAVTTLTIFSIENNIAVQRKMESS